MHRATLAVVGAILFGSAAWGARPADSPGPPDLSGTWKLQADSAPGGRRPDGGDPSGPPGGRRPEGGPGRRPGGIPGPGLERTLTIAQTDSTVTMTGQLGPARTYFTDGREVRHEMGDSASVVVRARWDADDLIIERRGEEWTSVEAYRFDGKGPRLIVIVEITPDEEARDRSRSFRTNRIYERAVDAEPPPGAGSPPG
jgi:hypothetical protein